jgi:hypothetical protein
MTKGMRVSDGRGRTHFDLATPWPACPGYGIALTYEFFKPLHAQGVAEGEPWRRRGHPVE